MVKNRNINFKLYFSRFLKNTRFKKQYTKKLKDKIFLLNFIHTKDYKNLNSNLFCSNTNYSNLDYFVNYIIVISFLKTNTLLYIMDASGNLKFYCSAGFFNYKGKKKKFRSLITKDIYKMLITLTKLKFLKGKLIALHLKNVGFYRFQIIRTLKNFFFIKVIQSFNSFAHNGCRKRKMRRKKIRTKKKRRNG